VITRSNKKLRRRRYLVINKIVSQKWLYIKVRRRYSRDIEGRTGPKVLNKHLKYNLVLGDSFSS
jgi:hypothetical protein